MRGELLADMQRCGWPAESGLFRGATSLGGGGQDTGRRSSVELGVLEIGNIPYRFRRLKIQKAIYQKAIYRQVFCSKLNKMWNEEAGVSGAYRGEGA